MLALLPPSHIPILLTIGLALLLGTVGAKVFQRLRIPQVVGYIAIGLAVGRSGFGLLDAGVIADLEPFSFFALGVIGFMIGGELHREVFRKYGRQFFVILFAEGLGAFLVVALAVTALAAFFLPLGQAAALGIVLGAISSATAPAATVDVLWEYRTRGILTTTVFAIVALDDGLALLLFALASSVAGSLVGSGQQVGFLSAVGHTIWELAGAVALGAAAGIGLNFVLRAVRDRGKSLAFIIATLALVIGLATWTKVDLILAAMTLGLTIANLAPRRSESAFAIVETFSPPIYVLFFVIVGAQLQVTGMKGWMWYLAIAYVLGRTAGKMLGAVLGGRWAGAARTVRRYLGLCLFSQAGVAIGLSMIAGRRFADDMGEAIGLIITTTTLLVQVIGPPCVKLAVKKAGEVGLNITEEDLMKTYTALDMVNAQSPRFTENTPLRRILRTISETNATAYPVIDSEDNLTGVITLEDLKQAFRGERLTEWLVAFDLMQPVPDAVTEETPLWEAMTRMGEQGLEYLPVIESAEHPSLRGLIERRDVSRRLSQEVLRRRQLADEGAPPG